MGTASVQEASRLAASGLQLLCRYIYVFFVSLAGGVYGLLFKQMRQLAETSSWDGSDERIDFFPFRFCHFWLK